MRFLAPLLLLAAIAASGCTQGDTRDKQDFEGTCPAWMEGLSSHAYRGGFHMNSTAIAKNDSFGDGLLEFKGHPLDIVSLSFDLENGEQQGIYVEDGILTARFSREDTGEPVNAYDVAGGARGPGNPGKSEWTFLPKDGLYSNFTWQVDLADSDDPPEPGAIRVDWLFERNLDRDRDTPSQAGISYTVHFWYRTCD
jgi:hypothetical protein